MDELSGQRITSVVFGSHILFQREHVLDEIRSVWTNFCGMMRFSLSLCCFLNFIQTFAQECENEVSTPWSYNDYAILKDLYAVKPFQILNMTSVHAWIVLQVPFFEGN